VTTLQALAGDPHCVDELADRLSHLADDCRDLTARVRVIAPDGW
jgi:hypothetical protein